MADKRGVPRVSEIDETNVHESIDKAIDHYFKKGMLADALFWSKCMGILRDKVNKVKKVKK